MATIRESGFSGLIGFLKSISAVPIWFFVLLVSLPLGKHVWMGNEREKMNTKDFINELIDVLELEEDDLVDENSMLKEHYSSLGILSIIALCDEQFSKELSSDELMSITTVKSLMELIGIKHFER